MMPGLICPRGLHGAVEPRPVGCWPRCPECAKEYKKRERTRRKKGWAWEEIRERVLTAYGHRCSFVGKDGKRCEVHGPLQIHHVNSDPTDNSLANLRPVCAPHHHQVQGDPDARFASPLTPLIG